MTKSVNGDDADKVIACDLINERCVFITFSDNDSFIFDSRFLYEHREHAKRVTEAEEDDSNRALG
ncbi:MAG TPA: hypothetical protein VK638_24050 [Edaphobacter sp.]|nr:hypothetical protein [Edaphobacter sp.]